MYAIIPKMKLVKPIFLISTRADNLTEALKKSPQAVTIWIRSGKYKDRMPIIRSAIVYETKSKADAKDYTKRFISILTVPKTHTRLSILKGISRNQIFQLLSYTKKDKLIRTQTHDFDRFKTKKTFLSWKSRGKIIYTLINRNGKLLGIIWFNKKRSSDNEEKPTIRIYSPARKKVSHKKFLEVVRKNYYGNLKSAVSKNRQR
jgi:hypothetical protein